MEQQNEISLRRGLIQLCRQHKPQRIFCCRAQSALPVLVAQTGIKSDLIELQAA